MNSPNAAVAAAIAARASATPNEGALEAIRAKAREAKSLELEIEDAEERIKQMKVRLNAITMTELPDLMTAAGVDNVGVTAMGNMPAFEAKLKPFYSASIPADGDEAQRIAAFKALEAANAADLIKTTVTVDFPKEERKAVAAFIKKLPKNVKHTVKAAVHKGTLTKWLREKIEDTGTLPDPDFMKLINGFVGRVVELKEKG